MVKSTRFLLVLLLVGALGSSKFMFAGGANDNSGGSEDLAAKAKQAADAATAAETKAKDAVKAAETKAKDAKDAKDAAEAIDENDAARGAADQEAADAETEAETARDAVQKAADEAKAAAEEATKAKAAADAGAGAKASWGDRIKGGARSTANFFVKPVDFVNNMCTKHGLKAKTVTMIAVGALLYSSEPVNKAVHKAADVVKNMLGLNDDEDDDEGESVRHAEVRL